METDGPTNQLNDVTVQYSLNIILDFINYNTKWC